jgi:hypothetical protein
MFAAPQGAISFDACRALYRRAGRDAFAAQHSTPVVIQCRPPSEPSAPRFQTVQARRGDAVATHFTQFGEVRFLRKRSPMAPFQGRIGVGRTATVDISFAHQSISKYHGYFEQSDDGTWTVADAGSKNGTFVNDERVPKPGVRPVYNGDRVRFGRVDLLFYTGAGFLALVESRVR